MLSRDFFWTMSAKYEQYSHEICRNSILSKNQSRCSSDYVVHVYFLVHHCLEPLEQHYTMFWPMQCCPRSTKVGLSPSKKICIICLIENPLKMMTNSFCFILKALFVLKMFKFLSRLFGHVEKNGLIRKLRLISKFMTSQPGLQTIAIHILPNILQSKGRQAMKSGQLTEYNKTNIFLQRLCGKWGREISSRLLFRFC